MISPPFTNQVVELCSMQNLKKTSTYKKSTKKLQGKTTPAPTQNLPKPWKCCKRSLAVAVSLPETGLLCPVDLILWDRSFMCFFNA